MNKFGLLKVVLVIVLSLLLIANLTSVVFAADDLTSDWENAGTPVTGTEATTQTTGTESTGTTTGTDTTGTSTTGTSTTGTSTTGTSTTTGTDTTGTDTTSSISTGSATTTLSTDENENTEEVNSLAYTGIEDNKAILVVIVIGALVAGYSLKKVKEYNI